jgi:hypothetical protein
LGPAHQLAAYLTRLHLACQEQRRLKDRFIADDLKQGGEFHGYMIPFIAT